VPTLDDNIASWNESHRFTEPPFLSQDGIATETQPDVSPEWGNCIDALLGIVSDPTSIDTPRPNRSTIEAAFAWLAFLKKQFPSAPPTCIIPEPAGGLIIERRVNLANGHEVLCELTFYNDERAERTDYYDGRIIQIGPLPRNPNVLRF
jgi:hypothetical protein